MNFKKLFLFVFIFLFTTLLVTSQANASVPVSGWAWSANIGWISFNSTNGTAGGGGPHSVTVSTTTASPTVGVFGGYAWSSNVGWLSFNIGETECPSGSNCKAKLNLLTGSTTGWARFCSGTVNKDCASAARTDGWEGWVELSGTNHTSPNGGGVKFATTTTGAAASGYAWGSDVVGWVDFTGVFCPGCVVGTTTPPKVVTVSINAFPSITAVNNPTRVTWTSTTTSSCRITNDDTATVWQPNTFGSRISHNLTATTTFTANCTPIGGGADVSASTTVTVIEDINASVTINANPLNVPINGISSITWSSVNTSACTVTNDKDITTWTGVSGNRNSNPLPADTTFTATCTTIKGATVMNSVTVRVFGSPPLLPQVFIAADPMLVLYGGESSISWNSEYTSSCSITKGVIPWDTSLSLRRLSGGLTAATTFTANCRGIGAASNISDIERVTVNVCGPGQIIENNRCVTPENPASCSIVASPYMFTPAGGTVTFTTEMDNVENCSYKIYKDGTEVKSANIPPSVEPYLVQPNNTTSDITYSYPMSCQSTFDSSQIACDSGTVITVQAPANPNGRMWVDNNETLTTTRVRVGRAAKINWRLPEGYDVDTCTTHNVTGVLPGWIGHPITGDQLVGSPYSTDTNAPRGVYEIGITCTGVDPQVPKTLNSVKIIVTDPTIIEI